jgi:hypothetical protein
MTHDTPGNPLNAGRRTRTISPAIPRALSQRDGGCRFPGCTHTRYTHGHHIRHWVDGGPAHGRDETCFRGIISGSAALSATNTAHGIEINATTIRSLWRGESLDYNQAIDAMQYRIGALDGLIESAHERKSLPPDPVSRSLARHTAG